MLNKKNIKLFITDVDGVLTDGKIYFSSTGEITRRYDMHDGVFFKLKEKGILTAFCSGETDNSIKNRAEKLKIDFVIMGSKDKLRDISDLLEKQKLSFENVAYVGDDINDILVMQKSGISFAVKNAVKEVKKLANYITKNNGGEGAIREIIDLITK
jgi:YrbI family 3-deoxy-D-manno-octulosonate 8-phosphate phosphatase